MVMVTDFYEGESVLVTGGVSFIGRHLMNRTSVIEECWRCFKNNRRWWVTEYEL